MMSHALPILLALAVGCLAGWYWSTARIRPSLAKKIEEEKRRTARAVQLVKDDLAAQLERKEHERSNFQARLDEERQAALITQSRLQADLTRASEQKEKLERVTAELTDLVSVLKTELQAATEEAFRELGQIHDVGMSVERAVEAYTQVVGAMESRLLAANLRLKKLGIPTVHGNALSESAEEPALHGKV